MWQLFLCWLIIIFCFSSGKVLGNLQLNLLSKSKVYEDSALSAIFLHNNYNYILKSLEKSASFLSFFHCLICQTLCTSFHHWHVNVCPCHFGWLQVRADPAGHGHSEEGREFLQRADQAADRYLSAQVSDSFMKNSRTFNNFYLLSAEVVSFCCSWLKVLEHLTDKNMPIFQPGAKVRTS